MVSNKAVRRQRAIQDQVARADKTHPEMKGEGAMQAGARLYPAPPFPKQHQQKPGSEAGLDPPPLYDAPFYLGSKKLAGRVAVITGGDSGIGRAVAILFAREGANIALAYLNEHDDARLTKARVEAEGGKCLLIPGDVKSQKYCEKAVARTVKEFGQLDVLVNNAAFQVHTSKFEDLTAKHFDETLKTNLYGYFYMSQAAVKQMKPGSAIVNTGSVTGLLGSEALLDYSMTKGGIHAFTRSLASHLVPRGIRVNAVAPGPVWTPLNPSDKQAKDVSKFGADTPMKRPAQPEEIAPAYVFLASPQFPATLRAKSCRSSAAIAAADMALEEYRRKRDFGKTSEPLPGKVTSRGKQLSYLIQKHDATRLHYDFRLELDGVLLSWAVTKGPSVDPADKRLAVRTEDHPLAYGSFEGTIPKGEYGGGTVMLWDRGTWAPKGDPHAGLKKGHLAFELHGERLRGGWNLVRMRGDEKRENWLLIKEEDQASAPGPNGAFLERLAFSVTTGRSMEEIARTANPMKRKADSKAEATLKRLIDRYPEVQLATLVDKAPEGGEWIHEIKFDGYRLLGFVVGGAARLRTRNGNDWTERFPSLLSTLQHLKINSAVLDMEAVLLDPEGKSNFQALQAALGEGGHPERILAYGFDLLYLGGTDLTRLPLTERKDKLKALLAKSDQSVLRYSEHFVVDGAEIHKQACAKGLEGVVSKRADARYVVGRQKTWLKVKCSLRQEFIMIGYSGAKSGERALGALYLGYKKDGALRYAGKVGTGFSMKGARELAARLQKIGSVKPVLTRAETKGMGAGEWRAVHWVKPDLLCEVAFTEWTGDGRIRHPSFQGLREDKDASDVKQEKPMPTAVPAVSKRAKTDVLVEAGITISHPDRVISETGHITKGELAAYHAAIAPFMLPHIARHPLSLLRCPSGIDGKQCFFQRGPGRGLGKNVHSFDFHHKGKHYEYLYIEDEKGLLEIIQMGAIELHPWGAPVDAIDFPDRLIFDLDPAPEVPFEALKLAARDLRQRLKKKGLDSSVKCTGGKGLHVTVALAAKDHWAAVKAFGAAVAEEMVSAAPEAYIATMSKAKRTGKIFIDYFRNDYTATAVADYGVRARPGAPVAVPLAWEELKGLKSASAFTMKDVLKRLKNRKPPAQPKGQVLPS